VRLQSAAVREEKPVPEQSELCVAEVDPVAPGLLDERLRELGLGRLRRSRLKGGERSAVSSEQTSHYASTLLLDGRRGYWIDLHADDPTFLGEVTDLLEEEGWEVVSCPSSAETAPRGHLETTEVLS
jgi:hypothetical protein